MKHYYYIILTHPIKTLHITIIIALFLIKKNSYTRTFDCFHIFLKSHTILLFIEINLSLLNNNLS